MKVKMNQKILAGVVACALSSSTLMAVIAYQNPAGSYANQGSALAFNVGMEFTVGGAPLVIHSLGMFDNGQDGLVQPVTVAIYRVSDQALITSLTFSGNDGTVVDGSRFQDVADFQLPGNTAYLIVAGGYGGDLSGRERLFTEGNPNSVTLATDTSGGAITLGDNYYSLWSGSLAFPTTATGSAGVPHFAAGTFEFTPVPEASSFAFAGVGLLGLVYVGRCVVQRRKTVA